MEAFESELGPVAGWLPLAFGRYFLPMTGVCDKSNVKSIVRPGSSCKLLNKVHNYTIYLRVIKITQQMKLGTSKMLIV